MIEIKLNHGKSVLVSDRDFKKVSKYNWWADEGRSTWYARGWIDGEEVKMHRFILGVTDKSIHIDHEDGNGLNNQRNNLRKSSRSQNSANRSSQKKYKGVYYRASRNRWYAQSRKDGKNYEKAGCKTQIEAAIAYNKLATKLHGKFARLNVIETI